MPLIYREYGVNRFAFSEMHQCRIGKIELLIGIASQGISDAIHIVSVKRKNTKPRRANSREQLLHFRRITRQ
jgi:hypothetical protein